MIEWKNSRNFFYWRLLRRLEQLKFIRELMASDSELNFPQSQAMLRRWYLQHLAPSQSIIGKDCDRSWYQWMTGEGRELVTQNMKQINKEANQRQISRYVLFKLHSFIS